MASMAEGQAEQPAACSGTKKQAEAAPHSQAASGSNCCEALRASDDENLATTIDLHVEVDGPPTTTCSVGSPVTSSEQQVPAAPQPASARGFTRVSSHQPEIPAYRLKVVGIPESYTEDQLRSLFSLCGNVTEARWVCFRMRENV